MGCRQQCVVSRVRAGRFVRAGMAHWGGCSARRGRGRAVVDGTVLGAGRSLIGVVFDGGFGWICGGFRRGSFVGRAGHSARSFAAAVGGGLGPRRGARVYAMATNWRRQLRSSRGGLVSNCRPRSGAVTCHSTRVTPASGDIRVAYRGLHLGGRSFSAERSHSGAAENPKRC